MVIAEAWFCAQWPISVVSEVCVWIIVRLEDPNMAHYNISNRVSQLLIFYLLVFDRIHDAMCLYKMSRTCRRNIGPQHKKTAVYLIVHMGYFFIPVFIKPILSVCCLKAHFFVSSDMWCCRCCLTHFFKGFLPPYTIFFNSPAVVLGESLATQTLFLTVH